MTDVSNSDPERLRAALARYKQHTYADRRRMNQAIERLEAIAQYQPTVEYELLQIVELLT